MPKYTPLRTGDATTDRNLDLIKASLDGLESTITAIPALYTTQLTQQAVPAFAWTTVVFNSTSLDSTGSYNAQSGKYVAPQKGIYLFNGCAEVTADSGGRVMVRWLKNGTQIVAHGCNAAGPGDPYGGTNAIAAGSASLPLLQGDSVEMQFWFDNGAPALLSSTPGANVLMVAYLGTY